MAGPPPAPAGPFVFERPRRDAFWGYLLIFLYIGMVGAGYYAYSNRYVS